MIIMKPTFQKTIDLLLLIISIILIFISKKEYIPTFFTLIFLILSSLYFFPIKLLISSKDKYINVSTTIIGLILSLSAVQLNKDLDVLPLTLVIVNFIYLVFLAYLNNKTYSHEKKYNWIILFHFLSFFLIV